MDEILLGYENGNVQVFSMIDHKYVDTLKELEGEGRIVGLDFVKTNIIASRGNGIINLHNRKKNNYFSINLDQKSTLDSSVVNKFRGNVLGTGGECNDLKLWDIETSKCIFKAKSVRFQKLL